MDLATNKKAQDAANVMGLDNPHTNDHQNSRKSSEINGYVDQILALAARGLPVFPCRPDKSPYTKNGFRDASSDPETIRRWWAKWPDALVGVATGEASDLTVVDIDVKDGKKGDRNWQELVAKHGPLPDTLVAETRSGGFHYFFKFVDGSKCSAGNLSPGIDIRSGGGYAVVAPSAGYKWINPGTEIAEAPAWLAALIVPPVKSVPAAIPREKPQGDVVDRARKYVAAMPPAISGQGGHSACYAVAAVLVNGFDLAEETALDLLAEYNARCVPSWSDYELQHKLHDALTKPHNKPRGWLLNAEPERGAPVEATIDPEVLPREPRILDPKNPYAAAQRFEHEQQQAGRKVVFHRGAWQAYRGNHYAEIPVDGVRAQLYRWADSSKKPNGEPVHASQTLVGNIADALKAAAHLGDGDMPRWIGANDRESRSIIAFKNGLLDVGQWIDQSNTYGLLSHTSDWFSANVLPFDFDGKAQCPAWEQFLGQVSGGDETWIDGLRMMFGYLLTNDTSEQKIFLLQGAPRSGKGTICRVLREMLGHHNVAAPSFTSLVGEFGLWPLVGKSAAILGDAHAPRGADASRIIELLKTISGEDAVDVNRKHRDQQTMRLSVRFVVVCNQLLDLPDPSGALSSRLILFPFRESFIGREDRTLESRLLAELPGILQWAMRGLRSLREHGRLIQPASGDQARADFARLSSPIRAFIDDRLVCEPGARVTVSDAFTAWQGWCESEGHQSGSSNVFGAKLQSAQPSVKRVRVGGRTARQWVYENIRLLRNDEMLGHAGPLGHGGGVP